MGNIIVRVNLDEIGFRCWLMFLIGVKNFPRSQRDLILPWKPLCQQQIHETQSVIWVCACAHLFPRVFFVNRPEIGSNTAAQLLTLHSHILEVSQQFY